MTHSHPDGLALLRELLPPRPQGLEKFLLGLTPGGTYRGRRALGAIVAELAGALANRQEDVCVAVLKGAQVGLSTAALGLALWLPLALQASCGYFLPTDLFARRMQRTRLRPLLEAGGLAGLDAPVRAQGLLGFGPAFLYMLGLTSINNAVSIPLDASLYDEVDILPADNLTWSEDRIAASSLRLRLFFSVGMRPGAGIDARFQEGTASLWVVRCEGCRREHVLEERFPDCLGASRTSERRPPALSEMPASWREGAVAPPPLASGSPEVPQRGGDFPGGVRLVCPECGHALDAGSGRWVDAHPARRAEGRLSYRLSQLATPALSLNHIASRFREAKASRRLMSRLRCSVLALPDGGDLQPLDARVLALARGDFSPAQGPPPHGVARFAGVDCGDAAHLTVAERAPEGGPVRFVFFEELDSDRLVERVNALWERLGLTALVIDAKPLRAEARKIAYAHPGRVWLQDFGGEGPETTTTAEHQGKQFQRVVVPREESLADLVDGLLNGSLLLPRQGAGSPRVLEQVDAHLMALRQEKVLDARGNTVNRFTRGVPNHFAMAMNSALVAARCAGGLLEARVESTGVRRRFSAARDSMTTGGY